MTPENSTENPERPTALPPARGSATWYATSRYGWEIKPVTVEKETDSCVYLSRWQGTRVSRCAKHSSYEDYWPTEQVAREHLISRAQQRLTDAEKTASEMKDLIAALSPNAAAHSPRE